MGCVPNHPVRLRQAYSLSIKTETEVNPKTQSLICQEHPESIVTYICTETHCPNSVLMCQRCITKHVGCNRRSVKELSDKLDNLSKLPEFSKVETIGKAVEEFYGNLIRIYTEKCIEMKNDLLRGLDSLPFHRSLSLQQHGTLMALRGRMTFQEHQQLVSKEIDKAEVNSLCSFVSTYPPKSEPSLNTEQIFNDFQKITETIKQSTRSITPQKQFYGVILEPHQSLRFKLGICPTTASQKSSSASRQSIASFQSTVLNEPSLFNSFKQLVYQRKLAFMFKECSLRYRGSQQKFSAQRFRELCQGATNTLVLVKSKQLKTVFGGFTPVAWKQSGMSEYSIDDSLSSFLFSLHSQKIYPLRPEMAHTAIQNTDDHGPIFGEGHDLVICDECNVRSFSHSNLGKTYVSSHSYRSSQAITELAGEKNFYVLEYEVWELLP